MNQKSLGLLTTTIMLSLSTSCFAAGANPYADVAHTDWSYTAVEALVNDGLVSGLTIDEYHNLKRLTRHDLAVYIAQAMSQRDNANLTNRQAIRKLAKEYAHELHTIGVEDTIIPEEPETKEAEPKTPMQEKLDRLNIYGWGRMRYDQTGSGHGHSAAMPATTYNKGKPDVKKDSHINIDLNADYKINDDWGVSGETEMNRGISDPTQQYQGFLKKVYLYGNYKGVDLRIGRYDVPNQLSFAYDTNINGISAQWGDRWRFTADAGIVAADYEEGTSPGWDAVHGWVNGSTTTTNSTLQSVKDSMNGNDYWTPIVTKSDTDYDDWVKDDQGNKGYKINWNPPKDYGTKDIKVGDYYLDKNNVVHQLTTKDVNTTTNETSGYWDNRDANGYAVGSNAKNNWSETTTTNQQVSTPDGTTTITTVNKEEKSQDLGYDPYTYRIPHVYSLRMHGMWGHSTWGGLGVYYLTRGNTFLNQRSDHPLVVAGGYWGSRINNKWRFSYAGSYSTAKALPDRYVKGLMPKQRLQYMARFDYGQSNMQKAHTWSLFALYRHAPRLASYGTTDDWWVNQEGFRFGGEYVPCNNILLNTYYTYGRDIETHVHNNTIRFQANWII